MHTAAQASIVLTTLDGMKNIFVAILKMQFSLITSESKQTKIYLHIEMFSLILNFLAS